MSKEVFFVAVRFDDVLCPTDKFPQMMKPNDTGIDLLRQLRDEKFYILLFSHRTNPEFREDFEEQVMLIQDYAARYDIPYDEIYNGAGYPIADVFIDPYAITYDSQNINGILKDVRKLRNV